MIPQEYIQEVVRRNDIEDIVGQYVQLRRRGRTLTGLCPFHNEKTPSFTVYPESQSFYCFGCGAGGDAITFMRRIENLDYVEAVKQLADRAGMRMPDEGYDDTIAKHRQRILAANREAARFFHQTMMSPQGKVGLDYFAGKRRLSMQTIKHFGLGFAPDSWDALREHMHSKGFTNQELYDANLVKKSEKNGRVSYYDNFRNRAMVPIIDLRGNVIAFGGRVLDDSKPKYVNTSDTLVYKKSNGVFALNFAKNGNPSSLIVCEGYMDVIAWYQHGVRNVSASLGTALTDNQARLINRYTKQVVLSYDADNAGRNAALRGIEVLSKQDCKVKVLHVTDGKDPDEFIKNLGAEEYEKRIQAARNGFMFSLEMLEREFDMNSPEGKTEFFREVSRRLLTFEDELERNNYIEAVATAYRISRDSLDKMVAKTAVSAGMARPVVRPKRADGVEKKKEDGIHLSQKALLTWMIEEERLFDQISNYISPGDFTEDLYRTVAELLYEQRKEGGLNPAKILNHFTGEEEHRAVASLFYNSILCYFIKHYSFIIRIFNL